jgi:hypothetical protein
MDADLSVRERLEAWLQHRAADDFSLFAELLITPASLLSLLRASPLHAALTPSGGGGYDVRPLQEQSDNVWHALLWKWLLVPRGLTILPNAVVFGMHKAFDFELRAFSPAKTTTLP